MITESHLSFLFLPFNFHSYNHCLCSIRDTLIRAQYVEINLDGKPSTHLVHLSHLLRFSRE